MVSDTRPIKGLFYKQVPDHCVTPYIFGGYRGILNTKLCFKSVFWWTNETINIWTHLLGFVFFTAITIGFVLRLNPSPNLADNAIVFSLLLSFQFCTLFSALYHMLYCKSYADYTIFFSLDLFGIALSIYTIIVSFTYYVFWCNVGWFKVHTGLATAVFGLVMVVENPKSAYSRGVKIMSLAGWSAYGAIPSLHAYYVVKESFFPAAQTILSNFLMMYLMFGFGFVIYKTHIPERFIHYKFDYLGHSHQWWHIIVVAAFYYWYTRGLLFLEDKITNPNICLKPITN